MLQRQRLWRPSYDADNRLTDVSSSHDKVLWEHDANYSYYRHGPLARTVLGQQQVQGIDYAYTLQGWLKGINSTSVGDGSFDMGADGKIGSPNSNIARDAYGISLNYFNGEYRPIALNTTGFATPFVAGTFNLTAVDGSRTASQLFNGNIAAIAVNIPKLYAIGASATGNVYGYRYDQLNRIKGMDAFTGLVNANNVFTAVTTQEYKERLSYDANGNIKTYLRNGNAARSSMDNMSYAYKSNSNQLDKVTDTAPDAASSEYDKYNDIRQGQQNGNYQYDAIGNLISDASEGISNISWNVYGKISSISRSNGTSISYSYDAAGNRISKTIGSKSTNYVRDATGNVMSIYTREGSNDLIQSEVHLYGISRLGILNTNIDMQQPPVDNGNTIFERGNKIFELSNHLQNVLVTISDKKVPVDQDNDGVIDWYEAEVVTAQDYAPFGSILVGRNYNAPGAKDHSYGFNGKMNDDEVKGEGNQQDYGFRIYDPRLGRFLSTDPLTPNYPWYTPYQFAGNKPTWATDLDGLEENTTSTYIRKPPILGLPDPTKANKPIHMSPQQVSSWWDRIISGSGSYQDYGYVITGNDNGQPGS